MHVGALPPSTLAPGGLCKGRRRGSVRSRAVTRPRVADGGGSPRPPPTCRSTRSTTPCRQKRELTEIPIGDFPVCSVSSTVSSPVFDSLRSTTRSGGTNKEEAGEAPPPPPLPSRPSSLGRAGPHPLANGKEGKPTQKGIGVPNSSSAQVDTRRQTKKGDKRRERKTGTRKDRNGKEGRQRSGGLSQPQQDCLAPTLPAQPWKEVEGKGGRNRVPHNAPAVAPEGRPRKGVATEVYAESGGRDSPPSRQPVTSRANRGECQGRFSDRDRVSKDAESNHNKHT